MPQKFPIGSRVGNRVVDGLTHKEIPMRVAGYDGLKSVIVEFLVDHGPWKTGQVTIVSAKNLVAREEVKHITGEAEGDDGPAIGWMELDGLSVALTRDRNGVLLIAIEKGPDSDPETSVHVRVSKQDGAVPDLWEGDVP